jgi:hypothetical protein
VDGVILHEQEGEAFLLHVPTGRYFGLNRAGLVVWGALIDGEDPVAKVSSRWPDVSPEKTRADVSSLVGALVEAGLARTTPPSDSEE